jgi:hypothetical protein
VPLVLDLDSHKVGPLRLGDPPQAASSLGAPKKASGKGGNRLLDFGEFELDFRDGKLACVRVDMVDAQRAVNVGDVRLSRAVKPLDVQVWFGDPTSDSEGGGGLRWIDFEREGATLALEFDAGGLACVQLYAEGWA